MSLLSAHSSTLDMKKLPLAAKGKGDKGAETEKENEVMPLPLQKASLGVGDETVNAIFKFLSMT